jgi:hypothetical protein
VGLIDIKQASVGNDAANAILSAVGYNLRLVLAWLRIVLRVILAALFVLIGNHPPREISRGLLGLAGNPTVTVWRYAATGNDATHMRMVPQVLTP